MEYSRTRKYEDLRNSLQNDTEDDLRSEDLSVFQERLNRIDPNSFDAPLEYTGSRDYDPAHAKSAEQYAKPEPKTESRPVQTQAAVQAQPAAKPYREPIDLNDHLVHGRNENDSLLSDDDYMNEYIREVKEYNIEQGNAYTQNTELNILKSLRGDNRPLRPFNHDPEAFTTVTTSQRKAMEADAMIRPMGPVSQPAQAKEQTKQEPLPAAPAQGKKKENTVDIPFIENTSDSFKLTDDYIFEQPQAPASTQQMTKADIAAEVQSLISAQDDSMDLPGFVTGAASTQEINEANDDEYKTRQQLIHETTQMRAQLDDYEENLSDVNEKMNRTNRVLNFVLIVLIVALAAGLGIVLYWILSAKGVL